MTATDELRRLLDERGIEYTTLGYSDITWWTDTNSLDWCYEENCCSTHLTCCSLRITPAQAIAATLGTWTCKVDETDLIPFVRANGDVSEVDYIRVIECSSCGGTFEHINGSYEFCPRCGRRIEVDE